MGPGPHGTGPSIAFWDTEKQFWHFQGKIHAGIKISILMLNNTVQQGLPFCSAPVGWTSLAIRIRVIRHQLSGVQTIEWDKGQTGNMKMNIVLSFPRVKGKHPVVIKCLTCD